MVTKEFLRLPLTQIIPYENNPRINDEAVKDVMESVKQCGELDPIEIDENNVILSGHTRLKAYYKLGFDEADVVRFTGLDEEQKRKYRLLANKTGEKAQWDFSKLEEELKDLDFDGYDFGFAKKESWFDREEKEGSAREEGNDEYNEFLQKFEPKKTTDDCYTPDLVYAAVANWVADEYGVNKSRFVRPFYPGGDYKQYKYNANSVVVDNPPFSILSEIIRFYAENNIKYFLFAPTLTLFSSASSSSSSLCVGVAIVYENGASVNTSFVTNLDDCQVRSAPTLYAAVKAANDENLKEQKKELPKYEYPLYVVTAPRIGQYSRLGIDFVVPKEESFRIRELDAQKEYGKAVFGAAYLISERMKAEREKAEREKAEREKAEREKAERWQLSEREMEIIKSLSEINETK